MIEALRGIAVTPTFLVTEVGQGRPPWPPSVDIEYTVGDPESDPSDLLHWRGFSHFPPYLGPGRAVFVFRRPICGSRGRLRSVHPDQVIKHQGGGGGGGERLARIRQADRDPMESLIAAREVGGFFLRHHELLEEPEKP